MKRISRFALALVLLVAVLWQSPATNACGPFLLTAIFSFETHPDFPLDRYVAGELGVVQPTYARSYLVVAYRHLSGLNYNEQEQKALVELWNERLSFQWSNSQTASETWLEARKKIPGVTESPSISVFRTREKPNEYEAFLNCPDDAFSSAVATLNARVAKFGASHPAVRQWVAAQDVVFSNCVEGSNIPEALTDSSDSILEADRDYQIAAANFYATKFPEARKAFEEIAQDASSQWQQTARYLVVRTLVRQASLGAPEAKEEPLTEAEKRLKAILLDRSMKDFHAASVRLLNLIKLRLHPAERLRELGQQLVAPGPNEDLKQSVWDYTTLFDKFVWDEEKYEEGEIAADHRKDELTDWIGIFQSQTQEARDYAVSQWLKNPALPWMVAALTKIKADHPQANQLIAAASSVEPTSPAFATAFFHSIRLQIEAGKLAEARARMDAVISEKRASLTQSGLNHILSQRMLLAKDLDDFLVHAQRVPSALSWDEDGRQRPVIEDEQSAEEKALKGKPLFDGDAARALNRGFPLDLWLKSAESRTLPPHLRRDVVQAAWLRAVILGDFQKADALAPHLKELIPKLAPYLDDFLSRKEPDAKKFSAIYAWLKFPGLEPIVDEGLGRQTMQPETQDTYRDNWWCTAAFPQSDEAKTKPLPVPSFVTAAQKRQGEREAANLDRIGAAPNYLAQQVVDYAAKNLSDRRVPEALHLAVKSTRYGCTDKNTGRWSKTAFDFLHRRYPGSTWAKKTPYWFKE